MMLIGNVNHYEYIKLTGKGKYMLMVTFSNVMVVHKSFSTIISVLKTDVLKMVITTTVCYCIRNIKKM